MQGLVIVDMLRGFLEKDFPLYCGDEARLIIPRIVSLAEETDKQDGNIIQLGDSHLPNDPEFEMFPPHCIAGSEGAEVIPELREFGYYIPKKHLDPFLDSKMLLSDLIWGQDPILTVVGVCTDICVLYTVAGLRMRGYPVTVYENCVASFNPENHDFALRHMEKVLGATVIRKENNA